MERRKLLLGAMATVVSACAPRAEQNTRSEIEVGEAVRDSKVTLTIGDKKISYYVDSTTFLRRRSAIFDFDPGNYVGFEGNRKSKTDSYRAEDGRGVGSIATVFVTSRPDIADFDIERGAFEFKPENIKESLKVTQPISTFQGVFTLYNLEASGDIKSQRFVLEKSPKFTGEAKSSLISPFDFRMYLDGVELQGIWEIKNGVANKVRNKLVIPLADKDRIGAVAMLYESYPLNILGA